MNRRCGLPVVISSLLILSCRSTPDTEKALFELLDPEDSGISFENKVVETNDFNVITYRNFYNGGGVAAGDVNNDGLPDLYFTANQSDNKLFINRGNLTFEDVTSKAGVAGRRAWSTGVTMADVNADGWLDIYVCNSGDIEGENKANELFINNQDGTFTDQAAACNLDNEGYGTHAAFFDYDADGDLDCYILNNSFKDPGKIELYKSMRESRDDLGGDKLMRNDGGKFTDVSQQAGIFGSEIGFGLGVAISDLNGDNWPDIYISNDFWERDYLYLNQGDGTFKEDLTSRMDYTSVSSMGADIADLNGDGFPEVFSTDMLAADSYRIQAMVNFDPFHLEDLKYRANYHYQIIQNCLHLNDGTAHFREISHITGVAATDWSWGALLFDFENNGTKDIFVANGIYKDLMSGDFRDFMTEQKLGSKKREDIDFLNLTKQMPSNPLKNFAFVNKGDLSFSSSGDQLGLTQPSFSNGSVYSDLDNDGDLDLVVNNVNMPSFVYKNKANEISPNNYLKIGFEGASGNTQGIGASVRITTSAGIQFGENYMNRGFESSSEPVLHFGLGGSEQVSSLDVTWPDGRIQHLENIKSNQKIVLRYQDAVSNKKPVSAVNQNLVFNEVPESSFKGNVKHTENRYNDFDQEILLHKLISTEGPRFVSGDCNGDQLPDFVLLGAMGDTDKLFIGESNGTFTQKKVTAFETDADFESTCGVFLDFDMDGDEDLLIGSGGNQTDTDQIHFIVRLYLNDGSGNFAVDPDHIPPVVGNFSTIEAADIDKDGDKDLFLGARVVPGNYALTPRSALLRNDGGRLTDITPEALGGIGMVTDASFADLNSDALPDLLLVGEWMPVSIFMNTNGTFSELKALPGSSGWWTRVELKDLDKDGDPDFVLGNWGNNSKFQARAGSPLTLFSKDFDGNGKSEFVINWRAPLDQKDFPFSTKMELTGQMPVLKKENLKYDKFARLSYEELFSPEMRENAKKYEAQRLATSILWNDKGQLSLSELPFEAQLSPVYGIAIEDFDKDGTQDIWLGGNFYGLKPQVGRLDASKGVLLKGLPGRKFVYVPNSKSGINLKGEVRDAAVFGDLLLIARNNETLKAFSFR